jgi:nucleoside-triphosphate--adenylate kinase
MSSMTVQAPDEESHFALILGKPGGGKGTISGKILKVCENKIILMCQWSQSVRNCARMCRTMLKSVCLRLSPQDFPQFHHLATGDLLRTHVREGTALGKEAKCYMDAGKLVPDDLIIGLLMEEATPCIDEGKSLLLDGFPRTVVQAEHLEEVVHVDLVINLEIPTEIIVDRIADRCVLLSVFYYYRLAIGACIYIEVADALFLFRWIHPASGRIYSYSYKPPKEHGKDDVTGEPLVQRPDDQPEKVRARLDQYCEVRSFFGA